MGITIAKELKFTEHLREITKKADNVTCALARLIPNVNGPSASTYVNNNVRV